jgi:hypothetical protein|nr:MAG TPA: homing endonuclease [Caudoviricetes sp.]
MSYINPFSYVYKKLDNENSLYSTREYYTTRSIAILDCFNIVPNKYTINTEGQIYDMTTGELVNIYQDATTGYLRLRLMTYRGSVQFLLHRLVAFVFCNPPCNIDQYQVNHINGNRLDCRACNLEWITIAANNQHEKFELGNVISSRPHATDSTVHRICQLFQEGKSNTEVMDILGYEKNNANHTFLRDIRSGNTWKGISCKYTFDRSSKKHAYTKEEKEKIKQLFLKGYSIPEIFYEMQGREYCPATDRRESIYRTIQTIQVEMSNKGLL